MFGIRVRVGGTAFSQTEVMAEAIVLLISCASHRTGDWRRIPAHSVHSAPLSLFSVGFSKRIAVAAHASDFLKI